MFISKIFKKALKFPQKTPVNSLTNKALKKISVANQKITNSIKETDPELQSIIEKEQNRQKEGIHLIASENFTSRQVLEALGTVLTNKYSEGYPGIRYYGGNEYIDQMERLCQKRALEAFHLDKKEWGVNVQSLSGSPANFQVYTALLQPHDRIMSLNLPHGGHLSHGYQTENKKISAVSKYFEILPYHLDLETELINYDELERNALIYRPKLIVAGTSAYSRLVDYERIRNIADKVGAYLLADMAHTSGLVAAKLIPGPFEFADVVTTTSHKTLRGPRGAMIFFKKGIKGEDKSGNPIKYDLQQKIDFSVFPGHQGGPHNHTITALAVALKLAKMPEFYEYQNQVLLNAKAMENAFRLKDYKMVSGGTDNHLILVSLRNKGIDGSRLDMVLEKVNIFVNKNTIPGDKSALVPSGIRVGSPAMTTRGLIEKDFEQIVEFFDQAVNITKELKGKVQDNKISSFKKFVNEESDSFSNVVELKKNVIQFASQFDVIV